MIFGELARHKWTMKFKFPNVEGFFCWFVGFFFLETLSTYQKKAAKSQFLEVD